MPRATDDDDLLPGLPPPDGDDEESAPLAGLDEPDEPDGDESVGLDTTVGVDADDDGLDVDPDESATWTADGDDTPELDDGGEDFGEEESGWTDDAGTAVDDDDALSGDDEPELAPLSADRGEEGVDEPPARNADDDDDAGDDLPPNDRRDAAEDDADDLDLAEEGEAGLDEGVAPEHGDPLPSPGFDPESGDVRVTLHHLGPADDALTCVVVRGEEVLAGGTAGLYHARLGTSLALRIVDPDGEGVTSLALEQDGAGRIAVGTRLAGVRISRDGGITFEPANGWQRRSGDVEVALYVAGEAHPDGTRLWARTRSGALYRSEAFGDDWVGPLLLGGARGIAVDTGGGGVLALTTARGTAQLARSTDGGARWIMRDAPPDPAGAGGVGETPSLAVLGTAITLAYPGDPEGPRLSMDGGVTWSSLPELRGAGPLALAQEDGEVVLYAGVFFAGADRGVVVRRGADGRTTLLLEVAAERRARVIEALGDPEGDNRVLALDVRVDASVTRVFAATGAGLFRLTRVRPGR